MDFFSDVTEPVGFAGPAHGDGLAYQVYDPDRMVAGKRMEDHLRIAVCYWHSFNWPGSDVFDTGTFDRPWLDGAKDPMQAAVAKQDAAFEFFDKLGTPWYCFHDSDMAPPGVNLKASRANLGPVGRPRRREDAGDRRRVAVGNREPVRAPALRRGRRHQPRSQGVRLRGGAGARPLPRAGGEPKRSIGFQGTLLLEPKPQEPTKHQYDYDCATVHGFLDRYELADEFKVNIEANHATLAGHSFHHEVAYAVDHGIFGSVDANRGDPQNGWGHRPVPQLGGGPGPRRLRDPQERRLHHGGIQLRHEALRPGPHTGLGPAGTAGERGQPGDLVDRLTGSVRFDPRLDPRRR
jgi:xylose isomerase